MTTRTGPVRQRRAGRGDGPATEAIADAIAREVDRTAALEDRAQAVRELEELLDRVASQLDALRVEQLTAVRSLRREGWSFARLAEATGLPVARVAVLVRATRARRL